ncbi:VWA domain-containing protein [Pseudahrensia aquimaris]|uniref:VWA domain-containing protein n=1 Tax=Pseudahrensia aquimaris TaxID=744461 RepID=A0ABW3FAE9_9HYPH
MLKRFTFAAMTASLAFAPVSFAQQADDGRNVMVVFDGSGSMWGQIEGRAKIEIARDVLSSVLSETTGNMTIGMIAYGHRKKGQCSDIETVVTPGPAARTVPQMINSANGIQPKGKTPLSDAVRMAAEGLRYTENEATVVLVTDGIETCDADPCALATELERTGINFTTHVVGFGLSKDEGQQVACLAENTGGKFISADDAGALKQALNETLSDFEPEVEVDPATVPRNVQLTLRDTEQGNMLTIRHLEITPDPNNAQPWPQDFQLRYEGAPSSAEGRFVPGEYAITVRRSGEGRAAGYTAPVVFTVEPGEGMQSIDIAMAARLKVNPFIRAGMPYDAKSPPPGGVKSKGYLALGLYKIENGTIAEKAVMTENGGFEIGVPPGKYMLRGTMDRTTTREREIEVKAGTLTEIDFDMELSSVELVALQDGQPTDRQTTYFYDKPRSGRNYWRGGYGGEGNPFYLAAGQWVVNLGREGGGKRRSEILLIVPETPGTLSLRVPEGQALSQADLAVLADPAYRACKGYGGVKHNGCIVPFADQRKAEAPQPKPAENTTPDSDASKVDMAALEGYWARIGDSNQVDGQALAQLCSSAPLALLADGRLIDLRRNAQGFAATAKRTCTSSDAGTYQCAGEGNSLPVSLLPEQAAPQLCLSGANNSKLCARLQRCDAASFQGLDQAARDSLEAATR